MTVCRPLLFFAVAATPVSAAHGQSPADPVEAQADPHHDHAQDIVVTGVRRKAVDVLGGASVLDRADLARELRPSLGETLARQPGVSATSFGPAASAPVLRGLSGARVLVLTDGIGNLDLSSSGPDHAVAINPLTAERIEVLRGPSALLFGSSAIGGVVNVIDRRIPRAVPDAQFTADALLAYGSAADERSASAAVDLPLSDRVVAHADASHSRSSDLRTGGFLLTPALRQQAAASADPQVQALASLRGELPNTAARTTDLAAGFAYIANGLNLGISLGHHESRYGVPVRFSLDPAISAEAPTIAARQNRIDARAELPLSGVFSRLAFRAGASDYRHDEIEETGAVGSRFFSKGGEARVELLQAERSGWSGASGLQILDRNVRIRGEEKFLPDARQRQAGLFTLQAYHAGPLRLEAGIRAESSRLAAMADTQLGSAAATRRFTTISGSAGGSYDVAAGWRVGLSASSSARAPSPDELFSNGPHGGSQAFERGDSALSAERSNAVELSLRRTQGPIALTVNAFYSRFSSFIYQVPTGEVADDLPVYAFRQGRARYAGFEIDAKARLGPALGLDWGGEFGADAVRATIKRFGPAPQIPPLRLRGALTARRGPFDGRIEVERTAAQRRVAPLETATPGDTLVHAGIDWHPSGLKPGVTLSLVGNNLFDVTARRHASPIKDYAPLAGRDIRLSARLSF